MAKNANMARRQPATAKVRKVSTVSVTDQGSQFSRLRTRVMGTSIAADTARNAVPIVSTHHSMNAFIQGVIGTTQPAGYSTSQAAESRTARRARVSRIRPAPSHS